MDESIVHSSSADLHVDVRDGYGIPVVLISGGPGMPDYLQPVAEMLLGHKTVTYDQRGTGASRALDGDYSVAAHVADLEAIRSHLQVEQMHLFGHSWGGLLAQLYATAHPQRTASLFLCSPSTGIGRDWVDMEREVMRYNQKHSKPWEFAMLGLWSLLARLPGSAGRRYLRRMYGQVWLNYQLTETAQPADPEVLAGVGLAAVFETRASIIQLSGDYLDRVLSDTYTPIYITFGEHDIYGRHIEAVRKRYLRASFHILAGCGHIPWMDCTDLFQSMLMGFYEQA